MARRIKKEAIMGRALITLGLILKIIQIIGAAFSVNALSGTAMTLITTCLLAGGLSVLAIEHMSITSAFALICIVGIVGGILPTNDYKYSFLFMMISFAAYAVMLISMKRRMRIVMGALVIALSVLLSLRSFGILSMPSPIITLILAAIYGVMGAGLYL